ncbi:hypothetical protein ACVWWO_000029 [Bradyrhizobium sp. F1.13.1]
MRFAMPIFPCEFELPDDWLAEAGWLDHVGHRTFQPTGEAYRSALDATLIDLKLVEPLRRDLGYEKDFRGFDRGRMVKILRGFVADNVIEAAEAIELPDRDFCRGSYRYRICNGVHRYFASIAAGYCKIPLRL